MNRFKLPLWTICASLLLCVPSLHVQAQQATQVNSPFPPKSRFTSPDLEQGPPRGGSLTNGIFAVDFETEIGMQYRLTYSMGTEGGPPTGVRAEVFSAGNVSLGHVETHIASNFEAWSPVTELDFFATTASTSLQILDITPSGSAGSPLLIDYVRVTTIPEPGAAALLGVGLIACGRFRRLRP